MISTIIDSNILLDLVGEDSAWRAWSLQQVEEARLQGTLVINPIIYAEVAPAFLERDLLDRALPGRYYSREDLPWDAAFLAGWAFVQYRRRGGARAAPLPDFYIGAHAQARNYRLLTRDPARFRTYFPEIVLIAPDTHP